jgi:Ca2+-dependent lipid-binding protein
MVFLRVRKFADEVQKDWYHNTGIILFACLASGLVVSLGGGSFGILFIAVTCGTYYRTSLRRARRNFRDDVHREVAKERLESDTESLEWINGLLTKMWPIYAPVLCDTVISSVDQVLSTVTPAMINSLRLKTFILGSKPPRLEHVKTYPNTEVDTFVMDWKFSFTPADTMDLTARQLNGKINPKVVLEVRVGKGLISKALDVIVEDMACSGLMRVNLKLQIPFPHIDRVDLCFVERPELDYVCKPLGGGMLGVDINFIPGLESFIKEQIHSTLGPMMYAPNVFPIEIAKLLTGDVVDQAVGVLAVTIHGGSQLRYTDTFAIVSLNSHVELGRTKTVGDTDSPRWNETIYLIITSFTDALTIQVHHRNEYLKNKQLGTATFALDKLEQQPEHENLTLEVMSNGQSCGAVQADIRFFPVLEEQQLEHGQMEAAPELNTGIARFTVEQAQDLDASKSMVGQLNPYGVLLLNGKEIHITNKFKRTNNPIFQDSSKEFLVTDRESAKLGLDIKDDRDMMIDPIIGSYQIKLNDMLKMMQKGQEWFQLTGAETGRAKLTLQWKPVALGRIARGVGYVDPIGVMRFHFKNAKDLTNLQTMGKSDSYARVTMSGLEKGRTVSFRNNLDPEWDEIVYVPVHSDNEKIVLEVMDEQSSSCDRSLGSVGIFSSDYIHKSETGEYQVHDEKQPMSSSLHMGNDSVKGYLSYTVAFYPAVSVVNPEDEAEEEEAAKEGENGEPERSKESTELRSLHYKTTNVNSKASGATSAVAPNGTDPSTVNCGATLERNGTQTTPSANAETVSVTSAVMEIPKTFVAVEDLSKYSMFSIPIFCSLYVAGTDASTESGFVVFKFHEGQLSHTNVYLEVLMDDYMFPSYISPIIRSKSAEFNDTGETFVRELEFSKITVRLVAGNVSRDEKDDNTAAKLTGDTLTTLQRIMVNSSEIYSPFVK